MQIKDLIAFVMRLSGRPDCAEMLKGDEQPSDECLRMRDTVLLCVNAVTDELARGYFPLRASETLASEDCSYPFSQFAHLPHRILAVKRDGRRIAWSCSPSAITCAFAEIEVEYEYVPDPFSLEDVFAFPDPAVNAALVAYGATAEYLVIAGDTACADMWERRYREEIERRIALSPSGAAIPPRRWI